MNTENKLLVSEIQRFCMHDGAGVRTTVFLKGCPLRCAWCHNPETQRKQREILFYPKKCITCGVCEYVCKQGAHTAKNTHTFSRENCIVCGKCADVCPTRALEICGRVYTVEEILSVVEKDRAFYGERGGVTLSGGEPFAQGEPAINLLKACKERGISTAVETCGYVDTALLMQALPYVDTFLWDVKDTNEERHKRYTGVENARILSNLKALDNAGAKTVLRCILLNGINTDETHYKQVAELALSLKNCQGVEWIAYHAYAGTKSVFLGLEDNGNCAWIPTQDQLNQAKTALKSRGVLTF